MARNEIRPDLVQKFGSMERAKAEAEAYRLNHQLTAEDTASGEWVSIRQLKDVCYEAGITNDGPNSIMVHSIGGDRALYEPWDESLRTHYFGRNRWFHKSALTKGIAVIRSRGFGS